MVVDGSNIKEIIKTVISKIDTENKNTSFNIIIGANGNYKFDGIIYPDKAYGSGIFTGYNAEFVLWRRYASTDHFYNISSTEI